MSWRPNACTATTRPSQVPSQGKTDTGRCWVYVRDDRPFGGHGPPAAMFYYSRDRKGEHPQRHLAGYAGLFQADAFDGYRALYLPERRAGSITGRSGAGRYAQASVLRHGRRIAGERPAAQAANEARSAVALSPIAASRGRAPHRHPVQGRAVNRRQELRRRKRRDGPPGKRSKPLVEELQVYMREQRAKLSRGHDLAKAIDYILKRCAAFTRFLDDGRACLSNNDRRTRAACASLSGENHGCSAVPIAAVSHAAAMRIV